MEFYEVFVETTREGTEAVTGVLERLNITGAVIEDPDDFEEFLAAQGRSWDYIEDSLRGEKEGQKRGIKFYLPKTEEGEKLFAAFFEEKRKLLELFPKELGTLTISFNNISEENWANNWKKFFKPTEVGNKLVIVPAWEDYASGDRIALKIDPGNVFGSGAHETTRLCLALMEEHVKKGVRFLDIGAGSGILAIGAVLLGAKASDAVDIDINAPAAIINNADKNGVLKKIRAFSGDVLEDPLTEEKFYKDGYGVIAANIVADIIIELLDTVKKHLLKDGVFIASGIIKERAGEVLFMMEKKGFEILKVTAEGEWCAIAAKYRGTGNEGNMPKFFFDESAKKDGIIEITGADAKHMASSLRFRKGEKVVLCNGNGEDFLCVLLTVTPERITAEIKEEKASESEPALKVTLFQALMKGDKMEEAAEKCTEAGMCRFVPFVSERSVARPGDAKREQKRKERLESIMLSAAKQSGRGTIPKAGLMTDLSGVIEQAKALSGTIVAYEDERETDIKAFLADFSGDTLGVFIGPEGGFTMDEIEKMKEAGITCVTLGKRILRAETAGLYTMAVLMHERG